MKIECSLINFQIYIRSSLLLPHHSFFTSYIKQWHKGDFTLKCIANCKTLIVALKA